MYLSSYIYHILHTIHYMAYNIFTPYIYIHMLRAVARAPGGGGKMN